MKRSFLVVVIVALAGGCSGAGTATVTTTTTGTAATPASNGSVGTEPATSPAPTTTAASLPRVDVPEPVPASAIVGTTPLEQAQNLDQTVSAADDPIGGWLAVYDALGIPVLGASGAALGTTGDDPVGPAYSMVWMMSDAAIGGSGFPLSDLARAYVDDGTATAGLGDLLLGDLRAAAASSDPKFALLGNFVAARARHTGPRTDLLDPLATADAVYVDVATAQLISWVAMRGMTTVAAAGTTSVMSLRAAPVVRPLHRAADVPCAESAGDETTTFWVNFLSNKLGSGFDLGINGALKGLIEKVAELNSGVVNVDKVKAASALAKKANVIGGLLSLLMQVSSLDVGVTQDPDPVVRNKQVSDGAGKSTVITWSVRMDNGNLPDGSKKVACAATAILNFLGVSFSFPAEGKLPGVEVTFTGDLGFGQKTVTSGSFVTLEQSELKQTIGPGGDLTTTVTGRAQTRDFPDSAQPILRDFSIDVAAQVEPLNGNSLFNVFFDGFTASDALGAATGAIDIAKSVHWDLGEYTFRLQDWQAGWKVDQVLQGWTFTGIVCDIAKPFTLDAVLDADVSGSYAITPTAPGQATWAFTGLADGAFPLHANGSATILSPKNSEAVLHIDNTGQLMAELPGVGPAPLPGVALDSGDLILVPLDTEECSGG